MGLEFSGFITECAFNAFAKLEFGPCQSTLEIGKPLTSEILEFRDKRLKLFDALSEVVDRKRFRPRPLRFRACHIVLQKCSPRAGG